MINALREKYNKFVANFRIIFITGIKKPVIIPAKNI